MMTEQKSNEAHLVTVADGVHAWIGAGGDSNAGAIETPEGVIVIDTQQYPRLARQLRAAVLAKTGQPLRVVVNTHCHLDHTSGNTVFADVPILAHEKTLAAMNACLGARSGDAWTIDEVFSRLGTLIRHVRGHDAMKGSDRRTKPSLIGAGSTDWKTMLSNLDDADYLGWITVDPEELPDRSTAAKLGRERLSNRCHRRWRTTPDNS